MIRYQVMFWNSNNEAIIFGTISQFNFKSENEVDSFLKGFEVENCTQVTVDVIEDSTIINSYSYEVES